MTSPTAAESLLRAGALEVRALATHGLFAGDALDRLAASELAEIGVTDTVALPDGRADTVIVLSAASLLAKTIERVFTDRSVSSVFKGLELFWPAA